MQFAALIGALLAIAIDALTMPEYRRNFVPGGTYFFTVNQLKRHDNINPLKHSLVRRVAEWAGDRLAERLGYAD